MDEQNPRAGRETFRRLDLLVGDEVAAAYRGMHVIVFGVGGVGGWCAEALARSGIGNLTIVDGDRVCASNVNRQLVATTATIGRPKVDVLAERLREINPAAHVGTVFGRYTPDTSHDFPLAEADWVVDAIDSLPDKAHLINTVTRLERPLLVSSMGAACRTDPLRIRTSEFWKVAGDGLARALRHRFRESGTFPAKKFQCVWSDEPRVANLGTPDPSEPRANGTFMHVTAAFGLALAGTVLNSVFRKVRSAAAS